MQSATHLPLQSSISLYRGETSAKISCSSTLLLSERVRVFVSQPLPHTYTHKSFVSRVSQANLLPWSSSTPFHCAIEFVPPPVTKTSCFFEHFLRSVYRPF